MLDGVTWVGHPQRAVAEARNHLARGQRVLGELREHLHRGLLAAQGLAGGLQPTQALLVGQPMEGPRQAADACAEGVVGVAQCTAHEVRCVRRDIAGLVVRMDHEVEPGDLLEGLSVIHAQHLGVVPGPVEGWVAGDVLAVEEDVAEDACGQWGDLGHERQPVLQHVGPVVALLHGARAVGAAEDAARLQREEAHGELRHGVHVLGQPVNELDHVVGKGLAGMQLFLQGLHLSLRGDLVGEHQPEGCFGQPHLATGAGLGQLLVALLQRAPAVADALHGVQVGRLADQALDAAHAADAHAHRGVAQRLPALLLAQGDNLRRLLLAQCLDLLLQAADDGALREMPALRELHQAPAACC
mmetsp:Transcript_114738/g.358844  ORF Transcript_114738/g.358844 Transcript_114738/m.358844 type:complete len:357 (-) Transcript_114738:97-1167(-)